jgi:DNA-binding transcriptional ArsR family regulator
MTANKSQAILAAIGEPTRLELLHRLMEGSAVVSELVIALGSSQSNISNHLAVLKQAGLVSVRAEGRQRRYELSNPAVASLVESILVLSDPPSSAPSAAVASARTCYDHLAGQVGVAIFGGLSQKRAFRRSSDGAIVLTKRGASIMTDMGIDLSLLYQKRRRFAFECMDWTEKSAHLGGSLGAAICELCIKEGWIERNSANRSVRLKPQGKTELVRLFNADLSDW